jgi:hypothetical protein
MGNVMKMVKEYGMKMPSGGAMSAGAMSGAGMCGGAISGGKKSASKLAKHLA